MIGKLIEFSVRNRWLVILVWAGVAIWGVYALLRTPVDAIPDLSENQVIVFADWMGRSPQDVEEQVTYPLSVQLQGLAGVKAVRSSSEPNFSMINIIFDEGTDFYFARNRVLERLTTAKASLPADVTPAMAPDATALGQIFWYTVEGDGRSLDELRALQDFVVRYQLQGVPGVAEVASVGGMLREYQVDVDPQKLRLYDLPLSTVYAAIAASNQSVGGKVTVHNSTEYLVRGVGWLKGEADLKAVVVENRKGVAVRLADVASVQLGPGFRRSALEKDGREAVGGVVMMRVGQNPLAVTEAINAKLRELQPGLPAGVRVVPFYDRTRLIESAIRTVTGTLREEMLIASVAVLLILTHFRSAVVVCVTLPMAVLVAFLFMYNLDIPSNIMSLCGIAISIGILVDAAVVMVENASHELKSHFGDKRVTGDTTEIVVRSCRLVGRPIFFSVLIMLLSFLPVFAFGGQEGKLSHPLAYTKSFAMLGVAVMAVTLVPALIPLFVRGRIRGEEENPIVRSFIHIYRPYLNWAIDRPGFVWWTMAVILCLAAGFIASPLVGGLTLAAGLVFVVLGVQRTGWTMWIVIGAVVLGPLAVAGEFDPQLPYAVARFVPHAILAGVGGLVLLPLVLRHHRAAAVASLLAIAFWSSTRFEKLGSEFMPSLNEGSIMDMPVTAPRVALGQAVDDVMVRDRLMRSFPEVEMVVAKVGRAETATDPSPVDMVETVTSLRPKELWPKRKVRFDDALAQSAAVARAMTVGGWLGEADWDAALAAVHDDDFARRNPKLADATGLLNTAAQVAVERFDRSLRELARRRQVEYEPEVAAALVRGALDRLVTHAKHRGLLVREPTDADRDAAVRAGAESGAYLARVPRVEESDTLLQALRATLVDRGVLPVRDDLMLDAPGVVARTVNTVAEALGAPRAGFAERAFEAVRARREELWVARMKTLDWELFDHAPRLLNELLVDALARGAAGTGLASATPQAVDVRRLSDDLTPALASSLFLWHKSKDDLVTEMDSELQMPGWGNVWTQPIINRVNMLATGVRTQIGVKVFGPTGKPLDQAMGDIQRVSEQIAERLRTVRGAVDVTADQAVGKRYVEVEVDRAKAARYGVNVADINHAVETAIGGSTATMTVEGRMRFPVRVRYARAYWQDADAIGNVLVAGTATPVELMTDRMAPVTGSPTPSKPTVSGGGGTNAGMGGAAASSGGAMGGSGTNGSAASAKPRAAQGMVLIPLSSVADVRVVEGPSMIKSENGRLRNYVTLNVRDRDVVGFVDEARQAVKAIEADLVGTGMTVEWTGEFENQLRARRTLTVIVPMVLVLILLLLYLTFGDLLDTLLVFLAVAGALAGSVMFQALFGFNFSVIVSIGYIAALGMATQTGVIMLVYLREAIERKGGLENINSLDELRTTVMSGAVHRLRPKLLTEGTAVLGLVPMLWATGTGAEIMRPMAAPVLGGLLISDEVIDLMIPVLFYHLRKRRWLKMRARATVAEDVDDGRTVAVPAFATN